MQKQEDKMKALSKAVLEQDQQRKMKAKLRNASYEPWKNPLATTKQTPFGNFPDQKKKELFDFSQKPVDYEPGQASTNVLLQKALKEKQAKDFGVKLIESKAKTFSSPIAPPGSLRKPTFIPPSKVPDYFDRGDLPLKVVHSHGVPTIEWIVDPIHLDYTFYLPLFVDGLREKKEPYRLVSILASFDLLQKGGGKIVEALPKTVISLKSSIVIMPANLQTRDGDILVLTIKFIKQLSEANRFTGPSLVPYYRVLLPSFNQYYKKNKNTLDKFVYDQRQNLNLGDVIAETLEALETTGGPVDIGFDLRTLSFTSRAWFLRTRPAP